MVFKKGDVVRHKFGNIDGIIKRVNWDDVCDVDFTGRCVEIQSCELALVKMCICIFDYSNKIEDARQIIHNKIYASCYWEFEFQAMCEDGFLLSKFYKDTAEIDAMINKFELRSVV